MIKVIYHANCSDGFCAAYLLWKKFGDAAEYIPFHYGIDPDYNTFSKEDELYIVDFSFKQPVLVELAGIVKSIIVLDHHKTAEQELVNLPDNVEAHFDMSKCGAMMVSDYLKFDTLDLVKYIQDRDLWKFELPNSKEVNAYIQTIPFDFNKWVKLEAKNLELIMPLGKAILMKLNQQIKQAVKHASMQKLILPNGTEYNILAVNSTVNFSEVAGELAEQSDFGVAWFVRSDGLYQYSLRSAKNGPDVSAIAKAFGGGGHKNAAGFESKKQMLKNRYNYKSLLDRTLKVPTKIVDSGYITIFGHDPCGGNSLQPSVSQNRPHLIVFESDGEGNRLDFNNFTITEKEMEGILDEQ